jgi:cyclophilin family peptidyl-prolyl cis-trans isomerase
MAQYREITIYGQMQETRPLHSLSAELRQNQPWGSAFAEVTAGMDVVDAIVEGDVIERVDVLEPASTQSRR